nr:hypothetical protein [uncultured Schaedlerella sp.]
MKTTVITDLPMIPEEYAQENYERIDWSDVDSEMSDGQRRFIHGLVQYYQPNKILELGVSAGGGTVVLLNALQENEKAELYSVDSATQFYRDPDLPVGHCALKKYSDLLNKKWHLFTGEDPACVMDKIEEKFDFEIWDQNADKIQIIDGYTVKMPDWDKKAQSSQVMIVMIENNEIYEDINKRFKKLGYILFHKIEGYLSLS